MTISQADIDALLGQASDLASAGSASPEVVQAPAPLAAPPLPDAPYRARDVDRILGLTVPVSVTLAERYLSVGTILEFKVGTIVEFDVGAEAPLTLNVTDQPIGIGQAVKVGENFGLRITEVADVHGRIEAMGGGKTAS